MWRWVALMTISTPMLTGLAWGQGQAKAVPTRSEIPAQYRWKLEDMYPDTAAWEADYARCTKLLTELKQRRGTLGQSAENLAQTLQTRWDVYWLKDKLEVYANQLSDQDTSNNDALALKSRATSLGVAFREAAAWIQPELLALPEDTVRGWLQTSAALKPYAHLVDDILRWKPHTLSAHEEELLAMAGSLAAVPEDAFTVLSNAELVWPTIRDEQGAEVALSTGRYNTYIRSADRRVRKDAFLGCMAAYKRDVNTIAALLNGAVQRDLYFAKAHGFKSALDAAIFPDNLPRSVYTNLVDTTNKHLSLLHRWAALRKKQLKLDELHAYDLYQPLAGGVEKEISYDQAVEMVTKALAPLGPEYLGPMQAGFKSGWVDVYETKGKKSGAYSWGSYDTHPYMLLNYDNSLREVSTLAHEMGHSMHSYFTHKNQPKQYGDYSSFVAEVASIFNEILLEEQLLASATDPKEKLYLLNHAIDQLSQTVFRQVMFAEFELAIHEMAERGEPLTAESMGKLYEDIFHKYWGPNLAPDPEDAVYWARIPHFYMDFYVFRYADDFCAAAALAQGVRDGKPGALEAYLGMLKAGSSEYPLEILRRAGVDMTTAAPVEAAMQRFERLLDEYEKVQTP